MLCLCATLTEAVFVYLCFCVFVYLYLGKTGVVVGEWIVDVIYKQVGLSQTPPSLSMGIIPMLSRFFLSASLSQLLTDLSIDSVSWEL